MTELEVIRSNSEMVVREVGGLSGLGEEFGYNPASIQWVEGYIERLRNSGQFNDEVKVNNLVEMFGSFLGECVVRNYGGEWRNEDGRWGVYFGDKSAAFPFSKVKKLFDNGLEGGDSISSFYSVLPQILLKTNGADPAKEGQRKLGNRSMRFLSTMRWWKRT